MEKSALLGVSLVHQVASVVHVFVTALPTVSTDSSGFNYVASTYWTTGGGRLGSMLYIKLLGNVYGLFGYSHFLGCQVSQVSFAFTLMLFLELGVILGLDRKRLNIGVLVTSLLPSCILTTSVTMREPFQMTGFLIAVYGLVRLRKNGFDLGSLALPFGALWLLFFHKGFAIFLLVAFPLGYLWATGSSADKFLAAGAVGFVLLFLLGRPLWGMMLDQSQSLRQIAEGGGLEYIDKYADQVLEGRTDFNISLRLDSLSGLLATGPLIYIYYLFSPLPWQIRGALDIEGVGESFVRISLLFWALRGYVRSQGEEKRRQGFLLFLFFIMEMTWAAGTANWGTAIRHRLVAWPLLVLLGLKGHKLVKGGNEAVVGKRAGPKSRRQQIRERRQRRRAETALAEPKTSSPGI